MWSVLKQAGAGWLEHKCARLGAALAYYAVFSMGPLLLIVSSVAGLIFGADAARNALTDQFRGLLGEAGGQAVDAMIKGTGSKAEGAAIAGLGVVLLLGAAIGAVVQFKDALNTIWEVEDAKVSGVWSYLRTYLISFAGLLALGFLLAVSLVLSAALAAASSWLGMSGTESALWEALNFLASLAVLTLLFAVLFKYLPDAAVQWKDVWPGAVATAVLFNVGKLAISWYIGTQGLDSTYGAAASIVVLLLWVYYASQLVLFGAEIVRATSNYHRGNAPS